MGVKGYLKIAAERVDILYRVALKEMKRGNVEQVKRCITLLRKIAERYNLKVAKERKRWICKRCNLLLIPGKNCRVRVKRKIKAVVMTCLSCNRIKRFPYYPKRDVKGSRGVST